MSEDQSISKVSRMLNPKLANKSRVVVKDSDMQIHVPGPQEAKDLEKGHTFKNVLNNYQI